MLLGIGKAYPAMLAGNTFIWKPSPYTPYSALKLAEIGAKVLPPGVFQALSGGDDLGPMLTAHTDVAKVSFTGSTETGKKIMAACASTLKRVTLELGGNDAAIICEDVYIPVVAGKVHFSSRYPMKGKFTDESTGRISGLCPLWANLHEHQAHICS
jgi:acyl-CoA reductase-like NAD-dependent aldehyde dehydrogenase